MIASVRQTLIRALPLYGAAIGGVIVAAVIAVISTDTLETLVWTTGVAALVPAAAPPLGMTARIVLALGGGVLVAAILWSSLFLLFGPGGPLAKGSDAQRPPRDEGVPVVRRADAHPDAPPRRPMSAADLGTPMMEVGIGEIARDERTIPVDLDLPLAAFDPTAMRPVPMEPVRPVAPLAQTSVVAPVIEDTSTADPETFVTSSLSQPIDRRAASPIEDATADAADTATPTPISRPSSAVSSSPSEPVPASPTPPPSIEMLLRRLEQGARNRGRGETH